MWRTRPLAYCRRCNAVWEAATSKCSGMSLGPQATDEISCCIPVTQRLKSLGHEHCRACDGDTQGAQALRRRPNIRQAANHIPKGEEIVRENRDWNKWGNNPATTRPRRCALSKSRRSVRGLLSVSAVVPCWRPNEGRRHEKGPREGFGPGSSKNWRMMRILPGVGPCDTVSTIVMCFFSSGGGHEMPSPIESRALSSFSAMGARYRSGRLWRTSVSFSVSAAGVAAQIGGRAWPGCGGREFADPS